MKMYVKKPIPVSALQWTGENFQAIKTFCTDSNGIVKCYKEDDSLFIETREGQLKAVVGDYIMRGIQGEFYPCGEEIFNQSYDEFNEAEFHEFAHKEMPVKSLHNTTSNGARKNVKDIQFWGDGDMFKLLCKASSENEGWMKSTKAMQIDGVGCVVQVTTQQRNPDGSYSLSDAITFVPNAVIDASFDGNAQVSSRKLVRY